MIYYVLKWSAKIHGQKQFKLNFKFHQQAHLISLQLQNYVPYATTIFFGNTSPAREKERREENGAVYSLVDVLLPSRALQRDMSA